MARYEIIVMELKEFLSHFKGVKQIGKNHPRGQRPQLEHLGWQNGKHPPP